MLVLMPAYEDRVKKNQILKWGQVMAGAPMQGTDSLEKTLMLGKIEDRRRRGWQRIRWLDGIIDSMDMSLSKLSEIAKDRKPGMPHAMGHKESVMT